MNKHSGFVKYIGPRGEEYLNEEDSRRAWNNYNNMHVHIGPKGEQYTHSKDCEKAWKQYNNGNTPTKRGR